MVRYLYNKQSRIFSSINNEGWMVIFWLASCLPPCWVVLGNWEFGNTFSFFSRVVEQFYSLRIILTFSPPSVTSCYRLLPQPGCLLTIRYFPILFLDCINMVNIMYDIYNSCLVDIMCQNLFWEAPQLFWWIFVCLKPGDHSVWVPMGLDPHRLELVASKRHKVDDLHEFQRAFAGYLSIHIFMGNYPNITSTAYQSNDIFKSRFFSSVLYNRISHYIFYFLKHVIFAKKELNVEWMNYTVNTSGMIPTNKCNTQSSIVIHPQLTWSSRGRFRQ